MSDEPGAPRRGTGVRPIGGDQAGTHRRPAHLRLLPAALLLVFLLLDTRPAVAFKADDPPVAVRTERPRFAFDSGALWRGDTAWVAIEVGVPYRELMFRLDGETYRAAFDLIVVLYEGKRQLTGDLWRETIETSDYTETRGGSKNYRRSVRLRARPGKLRVEVTVSEPASGHEGRLRQDVRVLDLGKERVVLGKIWFASCPAGSVEAARDVPARPLVSRRFGTASGQVCAFSRIYGRTAEADRPVELDWQIRDDRRDVVAGGTIEVPIVEGDGAVVVPLPLNRLWLGGYELVLTTRIDGEEARRTVRFDMDESTVSLGQNPSMSLALVRYIATGEEMERLENAAPEERQKVWDEFWKGRDPTPETEENEFKIEFFRRVRYANENYSSLSPGWKTDRGMIHIQYGPPDQIESYPHNIDGPPYEIWTYNALRRRFVFVDYDGFGRYELATPGRR